MEWGGGGVCERELRSGKRRREGRGVDCLLGSKHCQMGRHVLQDHAVGGLGACVISKSFCQLFIYDVIIGLRRSISSHTSRRSGRGGEEARMGMNHDDPHPAPLLASRSVSLSLSLYP